MIGASIGGGGGPFAGTDGKCSLNDTILCDEDTDCGAEGPCVPNSSVGRCDDDAALCSDEIACLTGNCVPPVSPNQATADFVTVGGGYGNQAGGEPTLRSVLPPGTGHGSTIGGGVSNFASGTYSTVSGGVANIASGPQSSTIGGGAANRAAQHLSTVGGGAGNIAGATASTISGGQNNSAGGNWSTIPGGREINRAALIALLQDAGPRRINKALSSGPTPPTPTFRPPGPTNS